MTMGSLVYLYNNCDITLLPWLVHNTVNVPLATRIDDVSSKGLQSTTTTFGRDSFDLSQAPYKVDNLGGRLIFIYLENNGLAPLPQ